MTPLKRRLLFALFGLGLLSICFWYVYEFLNLARIKQNRQAAHALCASVKTDMPVAQVIVLANNSKRPHRLAVSSSELLIGFGQNCECRVSILDDKVVNKWINCAL
jgi:hypothetical protein